MDSTEKKGFFARLFGKKNKTSSNVVLVTPVKLETTGVQSEEVKPIAAPISKTVVPVSSSVQTVTEPPTVQIQPNPQPQPASKEYVKLLSDLYRASQFKRAYAPTREMSEEYAIKLRKLSADFFTGCERIMVEKEGNTPTIQLLAILRLGQFLESLNFSEHAFADYTICPEAGRLEYYTYRRSGGICYDGGCYSDEPDDHYYYILRRISFKEYEAQKENRRNFYEWDFTIWAYNKADVPYADQTEIFVAGRKRLYLKNPMGILGFFEIEHECR